MNGFLIQTSAIFVDAYRELNARKLFWITLAITVLIIVVLASVGLYEQGITILWAEIPNSININSRVIPPALAYKFIFSNVVIPIWLGMGASILALVSTANMVPDFVAGGAIELSLSKPIGRARLLLTKIAAALMFVALQVAIFTVGAYFVSGFRTKVWDSSIFLAIPIVVLFFSYLFAMCALLGLITRSTIASLLLTLLLWFAVFIIHATEQGLLWQRTQKELLLGRIDAKIESLLAQQDKNKAALDAADADARGMLQANFNDTEEAINRRRTQREETTESFDSLRKWHRVLYSVKTCLPKTGETIQILQRRLVSSSELDMLTNRAGNEERRRNPLSRLGADEVRVDQRTVQKQVDEILRARTPEWILGTSIAFELGVLGISAWIFRRRDF